MHILDDIRVYAQYDPHDIGFGIDRLAEQVRIAWHDAQEITIPKAYAKAKHILVAGMGGSALGAHILQDIFQKRARFHFLLRETTLCLDG